MPHWDRLKRQYRMVFPGILVLLALALCWYVRGAPFEYGLFRIDALSAWLFAIIILGFSTAFWQNKGNEHPTLFLSVACLLLSVLTSFILFISLALLLAGLGFARTPQASSWRARPLWVGAGVCIFLGYGALFARGIVRYTDANPGGALVNAAFWCTLAGTLMALLALLPGRAPRAARAFAPAWLYPLVRLYSLGEWQIGWSLAALLLGGVLAGWCALAALAEPRLLRRAALRSVAVLAGALAGVGLGSSAGIIAACYALLCYAVLLAGEQRSAGAGAHPFSAAFVAGWMLIGASMAGGAGVLAGLLWLAALLAGLGWAVWGAQPGGRALGAASLGLGVGAPLLVRALLAPVAGQLVALWRFRHLAVGWAGRHRRRANAGGKLACACGGAAAAGDTGAAGAPNALIPCRASHKRNANQRRHNCRTA